MLPNTSPEEEHLLYLERLDETRRFSALVIEAQKKLVKAHFDPIVSPRTFVEGDLVLLYDQAYDKMGAGVEPQNCTFFHSILPHFPLSIAILDPIDQ